MLTVTIDQRHASVVGNLSETSKPTEALFSSKKFKIPRHIESNDTYIEY